MVRLWFSHPSITITLYPASKPLTGLSPILFPCLSCHYSIPTLLACYPLLGVADKALVEQPLTARGRRRLHRRLQSPSIRSSTLRSTRLLARREVRVPTRTRSRRHQGGRPRCRGVCSPSCCSRETIPCGFEDKASRECGSQARRREV